MSPLKVEIANINAKISKMNRRREELVKETQRLWEEMRNIDSGVFKLDLRRKQLARKISRDTR